MKGRAWMGALRDGRMNGKTLRRGRGRVDGYPAVVSVECGFGGPEV